MNTDVPIEGYYTREEALAYAKRIKNVFKRAYAYGWITHRFDGNIEPIRPPELSYMAAQSVRLTIGFPVVKSRTP